MKVRNGTFITALCAAFVAFAWVTSPAAAQDRSRENYKKVRALMDLLIELFEIESNSYQIPGYFGEFF